MENIKPETLNKAFNVIETAINSGGRVLIAGNGGSASIADHASCDWSKGTMSKKYKPLPVISLASNVSLMTAIANDFGYDEIFSTQLRILGKGGDVLILISSSGNSPNVLKAAHEARSIGIKTVGLSGFAGGKLMELVDAPVHVEYSNYGVAEDAHQILLHVFSQVLAARRDK
ncbi:MAG: hypothetical protein A2583_05265 [Bdellovibrionales bacterium RIFOXYD1_FULL_53_11]|nr:MAG: hypothetical protein A2583_05265 [Bdellovibrionales bacterium RIFOXYD1_FULL_53_11]